MKSGRLVSTCRPQTIVAAVMIFLAYACAGAIAPAPETDGLRLKRGADDFTFQTWPGPAIKVWTYAPPDVDLASAPIVFVMHGVRRDGDRYRDEWISAARREGLIVVAPTFSKAVFPKSAGYNLGNIRRRDTSAPIAEAQWSFSAIEPLFDEIVKRTESIQDAYALYGHSAGAQFVHRFLYFKPQARASVFIAANAGWYTLPSFDETFPYGLRQSGLTRAHMEAALTRRVVILLGDQDTDEADPYLRRTPEAEAQGRHRFARGQNFFQIAGVQAAASGVTLNWRLETVAGAAHRNRQMAPKAAAIIVEEATRR